MKKLLRSKRLVSLTLPILLSLIVLCASVERTTRAQSSSATNSQPPVILADPTPTPPTVTVPGGLVAACAEAVEELRSARKSLASKNQLIETQDEMLVLERQINLLLKKKDALSADEIEELKKALAAKDRIIAASEAQIEVLKKNQMTFGKKVKWILVGVVVGFAIDAARR